MLLSGFTFIRNAIKYDFPIREAIESMLPIVDELIVNVGRSEDQTIELIESIKDPKIKIVHSVWDDSKITNGLVLSEQTNIALQHCQGRWALYLQADEALHESEHKFIRSVVEQEDAKGELSTEGFRFRYLHFYGGYTFVQRKWNWYPNEIRIIRNNGKAESFGDAQTFRKKGSGDLLQTKLIDAHIYHYGHARKPEEMLKKIHYFHRFWHGDAHNIKVNQAYKINFKNLVCFWGTHPKVYLKRVTAGVEWSLRIDPIKPKWQQLVVFSRHQENRDQAKLFIESMKRESVFLCTSYKQWIWFCLKYFFQRRKNIVVDFDAETHSILGFLYWMIDGLIHFQTRVAYAPTGNLCWLRRKVYSRIAWGSHETRDGGFLVPQEKLIPMLTKLI